MSTYHDKKENAAHQIPIKGVSQQKNIDTVKFTDNRPEAAVQRKLMEKLNGNVQQQPVQKNENRTGLPNQLKSGIENLSGHSLDQVKVHYNSSKPAQLNALAYAQGHHIHLGPGQEKHLPHEAWHVVQQQQGRVKPTMQMKQGTAINNDPALEHEADVMGARALGAGVAAGGTPVQAKSIAEVAQLVPATVNPQSGPLDLEQAGGGAHFIIMQNPDQPVGNDVSNELGFTGILNAAGWADLGKSPANFWRAHGYAKSFGGAGDAPNVGWWRESSETRWTVEEQKVRGAGLAQIPDWLPGLGERGTYLVDRKMYPATPFKVRYVADLRQAVRWGMGNATPAWTRALASCNAIAVAKDREIRTAVLIAAKVAALLQADHLIDVWVNGLFGVAETNMIKNMKMTYTITTAGANPGPSRAGINKTINSDAPEVQRFGLVNEPQNIWIQLVNGNVGLFSQSGPPIPHFSHPVPYPAGQHRPAQQLRCFADGFGIE